jgi:Na+/proline symporter
MNLSLDPLLTISLITGYLLVILLISYFTGKGARSEHFFLAGRKAPWLIVAFGMIGSSLSGVTFLSVPGLVGKTEGVNMAFSYLQLVLGNVVGYWLIAFVLLPLYYSMHLTSIYGYLQKRLGWNAYKIGAAYFLISRLLGSSIRLFLVALILSNFVLQSFHVPFWLTVALTLALILLYTHRGGINTIIWTDTFQTVFMLSSLVFALVWIAQSLDLPFMDLVSVINNSSYAKIFFFEGGWSDPNHFSKQFIAGILIALVMTGMDQDMMQKNLSCKSVSAAQKNMISFSLVFFVVNLIFLLLGASLYIYAKSLGIEIPENRDELFALLSLFHFGPIMAVVFLLGLLSAAYSSADSALTALTTSFCVDFLGFERRKKLREEKKNQIRKIVHLGFTLTTFLIILAFYYLNNDSVINTLFKIATFTYGPLLGLFAFGILTKRVLKDQWSVLICLLSPLLTFGIDLSSKIILNGFEFGFTLLALNGFLTFIGLYWASEPEKIISVEGPILKK